MQSIWNAKGHSRTSCTFIPALIGILLVASLAVLLLAGVSLVRSRAHYLVRAEVNSQNLCLVLEEDLADSYEKIDLALLSIKDELERQLASGAINGPRIQASIERIHARIPALGELGTSDARGVIDRGTGIESGSRIDVSDREYFQRLRKDADAGLAISNLFTERVGGKRVIILARRIDRPDGSFGGMVVGSLTLKYMTRLFHSLDLGREGIISLWDSDQTLIVRIPEPADPGSSAGPRASPMNAPALLKAGQTSGTYTGVSPVDHVTRIYTFRKVRGQSQYLLVGLGKHEALADWYREVRQTAVFAGVFLLLILSCSWLLHRAWRKQETVAEALAKEEAKFRSLFEHAFEGIFQIAIDGSVLSLNPAFARIWGYASPEEMMTEIQNLSDLGWVRPEDREQLKKAVLETSRIEGFEVEFHLKDGTSIWVLVNAHLVTGGPEGGLPCYEGMCIDLSGRKRAEVERENLILELQKALTEVKLLSGMLPICSKCKKIRDDQGYWNQLETYISSHSDANFTHSLCPDCAKELFPEAFEKRTPKSK